MITIIRESETSVTLRGHAGSDAFGRDLVCAGVSTLVLTLEANLKQMHRRGQTRSVRVRLEPGTARLRCIPQKEHGAAAERVFDNICAGFQLLAEKFPENVRYFAA